MSIDRLSSSSALIAALRAEIARKNERTRSGSRSTDTDSAATPRDAKALRRELAALVKDVRIDDADAMAQARTRVIRAVLLWEFGSELREYSEWKPMIETLAQTLEGSDAHRQEFVRMVRALQTGKA